MISVVVVLGPKFLTKLHFGNFCSNTKQDVGILQVLSYTCLSSLNVEPARVHTQTISRTHTHTLSHAHITPTHTRTHARTHARTHTYIHTYIHTHTRTSHIHTHTQTHTHTHTHTSHHITSHRCTHTHIILCDGLWRCFLDRFLITVESSSCCRNYPSNLA